MDTLLFHPKLVHLPIALGALMPLLSVGLLVSWWTKWLPARSWVVVVALQAMLVLSGVMALRSGEAEAERVDSLGPEGVVHHHEEAAEAFVWTSAGVLGVMGLAWVLSSRRAGLPLALAGTLGSALVLALGVRTGEAGGALVYRYGAARAHTGPEAAAPPPSLSRPRKGDDD